jgi:hypothetical protein
MATPYASLLLELPATTLTVPLSTLALTSNPLNSAAIRPLQR